MKIVTAGPRMTGPSGHQRDRVCSNNQSIINIRAIALNNSLGKSKCDRRAIDRAFNKQLNARPFELQIISVLARRIRVGISAYIDSHVRSGLVKYAGRNVRRARRMHACMHALHCITKPRLN